MRWRKVKPSPPQDGDIRTVYIFLWLPLTLPVNTNKGAAIETRFLEMANVKQKYVSRIVADPVLGNVKRNEWIDISWN